MWPEPFRRISSCGFSTGVVYSGVMMAFGLQNMRGSRSRGKLSRYGGAALIIGTVLAVLASCSSPVDRVTSGKSRSKEYFAESEYGVKASPRVSNKRSRLKRGGGRYQVGKPYKIRGKWYRPKEDRNYDRVGKASWYGDAFHGRLTANGEIYDMTHLTGAHPTMPLPSYARVTNVKNGRSVIIRVNDRGPYAHGRIIDLSKRAAQLLDYTKSGVAKVRVQYVGRAPLHGKDDRYLVASYRGPGRKGGVPGGTIATGVMVAMSGPTPSARVSAASSALPRLISPAAAATQRLVLPKYGPVIPDRPARPLYSRVTTTPKTGRLLSYASERINSAVEPFSRVMNQSLDAAGIVESWKRVRPGR